MIGNCRCFFRLLCVVILAHASVARAQAPATQPSPPEWGQVVGIVARGLTGNAEVASTVHALLPDEVPVRRFGSAELLNREKMQQQTEGLSVISSRAYVWSAETIATDLASDLKACESFPDALRQQFVPRDASDVKRANSIAQLWVNSILRPTPGQLVAVVILWEPPPPVTTTSLLLGTNALSAVKQPVFVLIKGIKTDNGEYHITQIAFGDAQQALN